MCMFVCMRVCPSCVCLLPVEAGEGRRFHWKWSYGWLWTPRWVLRTKARSSTRSTRVPNRNTVFPASVLELLTLNPQKTLARYMSWGAPVSSHVPLIFPFFSASVGFMHTGPRYSLGAYSCCLNPHSKFILTILLSSSNPLWASTYRV